MHRGGADPPLLSVTIMRTSKFLAAAALSLTLGLTSSARAETPQLTTLRDAVQDLDVRSKAVRAQAERAGADVRRESERIIQVVDAQRLFLATRINLLQMLGLADSVDDGTLQEMTTKCSAANRLLSVVERWYRSP